MGVGGRTAKETFEEHCLSDHVPILRRLSGGGTVVLGPGCLCFSLILSFRNHPALSELHSSYRDILSRVAKALKPMNPKLAMRGLCDLAALSDEAPHISKKISGNAQRRTRHGLLHHGTLLYDFDLSLLPRLLREPEKMPSYRQKRQHTEFVTQLSCDPQALTQALKREFSAYLPYQNENPELQELITKRYGSKAWNLKR